MQIPANLRYTKDHEWVLPGADGTVTVGITDYAQNSLGDVTFVDLPKTGQTFTKGAVFGVVESVKAASDLYMPVSGEVIEVNTALADAPELVNSSPYGDAWMVRVRPSNPAELQALLDADAYTRHTS
jgi:glycine cleavage system H protein